MQNVKEYIVLLFEVGDVKIGSLKTFVSHSKSSLYKEDSSILSFTAVKFVSYLLVLY